MLLFVPIGHERQLRRRPYVTGVIVAICVALQIYQSAAVPSEETLYDEMEEVLQEVMSTPDVERGAVNRTIGSISDDPRGAFERLGNGEVAGLSEETRRRARGVVEKIDAIRAKDLTWRWAERTDSPGINLLLSLFVHGGWIHLIGNMLFLWVVGPAVEDRWGHGVFAAFYFLGGIVATYVFRIMWTGGDYALVGASGAISGAMGAFLVCFTHLKLRIWYFVFLFFYIRSGVFTLAAWIPLGLWFGEQVFATMFEGESFVAYSAHVGGFVAGAAIAYILRRSGVEKSHLLTKEYAAEEDELETERKQATEKDDLEEALGYARSGNRGAAIGVLRALVLNKPNHPSARRELVYIALEHGDKEEARLHASHVLLEAAKSGHDDVIAFYRHLEKHAVHDALIPRAIAQVVRSATATGDGVLAVSLTRHLLQNAPHLPTMPGLLWEVALLQEKQGREDLSARTLQILLQKYGADPIAEQARKHLAARWQ